MFVPCVQTNCGVIAVVCVVDPAQLLHQLPRGEELGIDREQIGEVAYVDERQTPRAAHELVAYAKQRPLPPLRPRSPLQLAPDLGERLGAKPLHVKGSQTIVACPSAAETALR